MEENQDITTPLDIPSFDYNKLNELRENQEKNNQLLEQLLNNQEKLNDYLIPTDEEIKKQELEDKKLHEEQKKLEEQKLHEEQEQEEKLIQDQQEQQEYNQQVLYELKTLNENIGKVEFANQNTNVYLYILCFGLLVTFVIFFIYKLIRKFF